MVKGILAGVIVAGRVINRRLDGRRSLLYIHVGLILIGMLLLIQALEG